MTQLATATTPHADLPPAWGVTSFDPWDPRITNDNIWPVYRAMREAGRVLTSDAHGGYYLLTHYADIRAAAADFRSLASGQGVLVGRQKARRSIPLEFDRPEHTRYRKPMQQPFLRSQIGQFTDLVRREVDELLDRAAARAEVDLVRDIAAPLPLGVISEFLGVPRERRELHARVGADLVHATPDQAQAADDAYYAFMLEEVRARRERPGDDFISQLWGMEPEGGAFTEDEVLGMARALALAGFHTTINGTAGMLLRMTDPDARARYLADRDLAPRIIAESLRLDPPIHYEARTSTTDLTIADVEIPEGMKVALLYASGNHDEEVYPDPERFDITRDGPPHLSFGHGVHKCLGEHLSLLEMQIVLEQIFDRFPDYELIGDAVGAGMVYGHHMAWASMPARLR
jgi:cytochrome P450